MNAIFILVIKMYLTSPLGAGIQKNHGASQFQTSSFLCERLLGGPTHHEGLAIDRTFDSSKKLAIDTTEYEFNVSPETPPKRHPLTLHTSSVVKVDRDY